MKETQPKEPATGWQYKSADPSATKSLPVELSEAPTASARAPKEGAVEWTASEFIAHHKGLGWYLVLLIVTLIVAGLVYLITRDKVAIGAVVGCALLFGATAARKPHVITCRLDDVGLTVGDTLYPYGHYKAFALVEEGPFTSIVFLPLKRFALSISVYCAPDEQDRIVRAASAHLPLQRSELDTMDQLMRNLRF